MSVHGTTQVAGVWGWPVRHSASPAMHNAAFAELGLDWVYVPFAVDPERVAEAVAGVRALGLRGVNVTVPLKEKVPAFLDGMTERAARLGAVNTLFFEGDRLLGDSTDGPGFLAALAHDGVIVEPGMRAVVLGAGGSARAVVDALASAGARVVVANRTVARTEGLRALGMADAVPLTGDALETALDGARLLVNTTTVGMHPNPDDCPCVPDSALKTGLFVADLIYNPVETRLLARARARGCRGQNGIEMLVRQGALAFERWTGAPAPVEAMRTAVQRELKVE